MKIFWIALTIALGYAVLSLPAVGQVVMGEVATGRATTAQAPIASLTEPNPSVENTLSCVQPQTLQIPRSVAKRAKVKAQLMNVLRDSIFDDAKGIVNLARERQIKELINKLKRDKAE